MTEEERIAVLAQRLQDHIDADHEFRESLKTKLDGIETKVDSLVGFFEQGKGMIKLLAILAAAGTAIGTIFAFAKTYFIIHLK